MKTISHLTKALLISALFFHLSCKEEQIDEVEEEQVITTDISGVVQKGPFNVGTTVTLSELNESYNQTGKTFYTQINSDDGSFKLEGVELTSPYVVLKADGFYFNEISGENSSARLALNAIVDVTDKSNLNINILTHLEKPRVEFLLENGYEFSEAKEKAKAEILDIFSFEGTSGSASEMLDITKPGTDNAILLAMSAIAQGYRSVADVSEMLTNVANDLKEDGTLDNPELQTDIISHALFIDAAQVKENLNSKYSGMDEPASIPELGQFIQQFIEATSYTPVPLVNYPEQSSMGLNILNSNNSTFSSGMETNYSMAAESIPGIELKVVLELMEGNTHGFGGWGYRMGQINWTVSNYDYTADKQVFQMIDTNLPSDLQILFMSADSKIRITYYEGTLERSRIIKVE